MNQRTITIPAGDFTNWQPNATVTLPWVCPVCGGPRGEPAAEIPAGRKRVAWKNPCGHRETYDAVRREAGLACYEAFIAQVEAINERGGDLADIERAVGLAETAVKKAHWVEWGRNSSMPTERFKAAEEAAVALHAALTDALGDGADEGQVKLMGRLQAAGVGLGKVARPFFRYVTRVLSDEDSDALLTE